TNVLSTFLLASLLTPMMTKTAQIGTPECSSEFKPHIVLLNSDAHLAANFSQKDAPVIYDSLNEPHNFDGYERYRTTKLMGLLLLPQLCSSSSEKGNDEVIICAVNPGFCKSEKVKKLPNWNRRFLYRCFAITTAEAAENIVWACLEDAIPSGSYVRNRAVSWSNPSCGQKRASSLRNCPKSSPIRLHL
ncbi:6120_t:CDS:2, partial [Acaulospora colombiana]